MTQLSGLKRSMPCKDLCSMTEPSVTSSMSSVKMMTPQLIKDYDSDDASATSCMDLSSILKLNNRIMASYNSNDDLDDSSLDDVWDFESFDMGRDSQKRQKLNTFDTSTPATEALSLVLEEAAQDTLDKLMDMHIHHCVSPVEPMFQSSYLVHPFFHESVMNRTTVA